MFFQYLCRFYLRSYKISRAVLRAARLSFTVGSGRAGSALHSEMLLDKQLDGVFALVAGLHHFGENGVDSVKQLGIALGYGDGVILGGGGVLLALGALVEQGGALVAAVFRGDVLRGQTVDDDDVDLVRTRGVDGELTVVILRDRSASAADNSPRRSPPERRKMPVVLR